MKLDVKDISVSLGAKSARKQVLHNVSFTAPEGSFVSLLGESGAGKSTLLKIISGVLVQDEGSVCFDDAPVDDLPAHKRNLGFVFQDMRLFPNMTVGENVSFACKMAGWPKSDCAARATSLLERVQLAGFEDRSPRSLSGGQAQRVALARALAAKPVALLLDEPFSGLDESLRDDMRSLLLHLHREYGVTTIMVTHDASEALMMSDRIVYMADGRVLQEGEPDELFMRPQAEEVAACFGNCSRVTGLRRDDRFVAGPLSVPMTAAAPHASAADARDGGEIHAVLRYDDCVVWEDAANPAAALLHAAADETTRADADAADAPASEPLRRYVPVGSFLVRCCVYHRNHWLLRLDVDGQTLTVPSYTAFEPDSYVRVYAQLGTPLLYAR